MQTANLGEADGLPTIEWSQVETQLADLLTHDDPRSPNRATFWLTTLNADGSPHVTSVGPLWQARDRPDDSGTGITAPFNAPGLGPPPWFIYEVKPRTATAVGTAEETPGSTRWRF